MGTMNEEEFELNEMEDTIHGSVGSRLSLFAKEFGFGRNKWDTSALRLPKECSSGMVIHPHARLYMLWVKVVFMWSIFSAFFTPLEFGFFRGWPDKLENLDYMQIIFVVDMVICFFVAYRDEHTYRMVYDKKSIATRYMKSSFALDLLGCFPWDGIYKVAGRREIIRYLLWTRLYRSRKIIQFFKKMEKDIRINYLFTRIVKLITVELYCTHTAACIFYYLATTLPPAKEGYTWIGSLSMGDYKYINFREIDFWQRYITSLYFAIVTMATVGYGDVHAVNTREMIFIMIYISFDMILGAYLIGNMTALIVKGSNTERFRDKMTDLIKYMNRNKLDKEIRSQIRNHLRLQYESSYTKTHILDDIPVAVRSKHRAASKGYEDIVRFLIQRGANINCIDKFGNSPLLEAVKAGHDRVAKLLVERGAVLKLEDAGSYLCKVVTDSKIEILRRLLENGVDPNSRNYDQRTPLHVAAAEGLHLVAYILIDFGADIHSKDRWGNTPLDEGKRCGSKPLLQILEQASTNHI